MSRKDLFIHTDSEGYEPALITTDDESDPVIISCEGIQALGGMVLRLLLTPRGSWPGNRTEGCELAEIAGSVFDKTTLSAVASRSVLAIQSTIHSFQMNTSVPPEERLRELELESVEVLTDGHAVIRILVTSYSGDSVVVTSGND